MLVYYNNITLCYLFEMGGDLSIDLLVCVDKERRDGPNVFELAGGIVEEEKMKDHEFCLKLTCGAAGDKLVFLSFSTQRDCVTWFAKCVKVCASCFYVYVSVIK